MKKKYVDIAFIYGVLAMIGGVFYREYPKIALKGHDVIWAFIGTNPLSKVHGHLFVLGMFFFLILALITARVNIEKDKNFNLFMLFYNLGLNITVIMMLIKGIKQLQLKELTKTVERTLSICAGLGHVMLGVGIILFFIILRKFLKEKEIAN